MKRRTAILIFLLQIALLPVYAQPVPAEDENIPYLVTFGTHASATWGDDDDCMIFFFSVPVTHKTPIYIRVFDPNIGGQHDEMAGGVFDTKMRFSVYGGPKAFTHPDAQGIEPKGNYDSGNLLGSKVFDDSPEYDNKWYTFGPFNPVEGELVEHMGGYLFKMIAKGITGNDGNLYRYFMSTSPTENRRIEGGNAFTYEYTFRLHNEAGSVSHIYPFVDSKVISIKQHNFDFDKDGLIRVVSVAKKGILMTPSGQAEWATSEHKIEPSELNTSLDVQFIKGKSGGMRNNNIVFYITNQYEEFIPFFTIPIGGVPKYDYQIGVKQKPKN